MENFAKFLLEKNILQKEEIEKSVNDSRITGHSLEECIIANNYLNPINLYKALASFLNADFINLQENHIDKSILDKNERDNYIKLSAIPICKMDNYTVIATSNHNKKTIKWLDEKYGDNYKLVITTPFDIHHAVNNEFSKENSHDAIFHLWEYNPLVSARNLFNSNDSLVFIIFIFAIIGSLLLYPKIAGQFLFTIVLIFYAATISLKAILFAIGMLENNDKKSPLTKIANQDLPIYTLLIPLYKEDTVLNKLISAIRAIDYPKTKLDVKLIVEEDDKLTIDAIKNLKCERIFEIIKVPYSLPRTKPKACNYALRFARGEYVTIYDAEDIPDPHQLKKALYVFENSDDDVVCVQARLNYFNWDDNILTKLFSIEYSNLFDFMLPALQKLRIPIPLGGTSNHFHIKTLKELYAWDPFNVTEDADLGIRLAQKGWRTEIINSYTMEEAPISLIAWIKQRSRWIKGHIQTYFVHMRKPIKLYKQIGLLGFFGFQFFLGAPALIFIISPFMWGMCLLFLLKIINPENFSSPLFYSIMNMSYLIFFIGVISQIVFAVFSVALHSKKSKWEKMEKAILLFPFYWFLHSIASFKAVWQLITKPHYWEKTNHGITKSIK